MYIIYIFPKDGPLGKAFNRSNLKLSYSTLPNMKQIISAHNRKVLANIKPPIPVEDPPQQKTCNCTRRTMEENGGCPLQGKCLMTNVVYQADVVETKVDWQEEVDTWLGGVCLGLPATALELPHNTETVTAPLLSLKVLH